MPISSKYQITDKVVLSVSGKIKSLNSDPRQQPFKGKAANSVAGAPMSLGIHPNKYETNSNKNKQQAIFINQMILFFISDNYGIAVGESRQRLLARFWF